MPSSSRGWPGHDGSIAALVHRAAQASGRRRGTRLRGLARCVGDAWGHAGRRGPLDRLLDLADEDRPTPAAGERRGSPLPGKTRRPYSMLTAAGRTKLPLQRQWRQQRQGHIQARTAAQRPSGRQQRGRPWQAPAQRSSRRRPRLFRARRVHEHAVPVRVSAVRGLGSTPRSRTPPAPGTPAPRMLGHRLMQDDFDGSVDPDGRAQQRNARLRRYTDPPGRRSRGDRLAAGASIAAAPRLSGPATAGRPRSGADRAESVARDAGDGGAPSFRTRGLRQTNTRTPRRSATAGRAFADLALPADDRHVVVDLVGAALAEALDQAARSARGGRDGAPGRSLQRRLVTPAIGSCEGDDRRITLRHCALARQLGGDEVWRRWPRTSPSRTRAWSTGLRPGLPRALPGR